MAKDKKESWVDQEVKRISEVNNSIQKALIDRFGAELVEEYQSIVKKYNNVYLEERFKNENQTTQR